MTKERLYYPLTQQAQGRGGGMALVLKTGLDPQSLVPQVRAAVRAIDPEQPIADVRTMEQWLSRSLQNRRTNMMLLTVFGAVALVLSAIGIYGVLAFGVAQRVREFGIRQALGADRSSILSLVLKQGLKTAGLGIVLGLAASVGLARLLADAAVRRDAARPGCIRRRDGRVVRRRDGGLLHPGPARHARRPDGRAAGLLWLMAHGLAMAHGADGSWLRLS